jgi:hypothetical protein
VLRVRTLYASSSVATARYYTKYLAQAPGEVPGQWTGQQATVRFPVTVVTPGDVVRIPRLALIRARFPVFGAYQIRVSSALAVLATLDIIARRSGEEDDPA